MTHTTLLKTMAKCPIPLLLCVNVSTQDRGCLCCRQTIHLPVFFFFADNTIIPMRAYNRLRMPVSGILVSAPGGFVLKVYLLIILAAGLLPSLAVSQDCIDYGDYLHWVGAVDTPGNERDVEVLDNYAYVASGGLQVIDISVPEFPSIVCLKYLQTEPMTQAITQSFGMEKIPLAECPAEGMWRDFALSMKVGEFHECSKRCTHQYQFRGEMPCVDFSGLSASLFSFLHPC